MSTFQSRSRRRAALLALAAALTVAAPIAEARPGGGGSMGSRGSRTYTAPSATPTAPGGGMTPAVVPVEWEIARDERMDDVVRRGRVWATPDWAHSVHVEPAGLEPGRWYWYRFRAGGAESPIGRTRTAPPANAVPERMRFAFASC